MPKLDLLKIPRFLDWGLVRERARELALADGKEKGYEDATLTRHANLQWRRFRKGAAEEFFNADYPDAKPPKLEPAISTNPFGDIADQCFKRKVLPALPPDGFTKARMFDDVEGPPKERAEAIPELPVRRRVRPAA